jgi:hypothetical protein
MINLMAFPMISSCFWLKSPHFMAISWPCHGHFMAISLTPGLLQAMWDRGSQVSQVAMTVCGAGSWKLGQLMIRTKHVAAGKNLPLVTW